MRPAMLATVLLTSLAALAPAVMAATGLTIGPTPTSDRRFPFVTEGPAFTGTPLAVRQARLPGVTIVTGAPEDGQASSVASLALMLGQWTEAPSAQPLVRNAGELNDADLAQHHLIILGKRNALVERLGAKVPRELGERGPTLWVVEDAFAPGKHVMILAGRTPAEVSQATDYLANERLFFKAGAYDGFLAFVRLRGYLEKSNFAAAADLLDDPRQLKGCAKPVEKMAPKMPAMPPEARALAQKRNQLVFGGIKEAIAKEDAPLAIARWQETMQTCYACHQGRGGPQVRTYKPLEYPHRRHQEIARSAGLDCTTCHRGVTEVVGYGK
ncbi:Bacterial cellulose synthase subunit [compost metagenome]